MNYYSTKNLVAPVGFEEAIFKGLPDDNGLFMPEVIPQLPSSFFENIAEMSLPEIGFEVIKPFVDGEIPDEELKAIVTDTLSFNIPVKKIRDGVYSLELFHGPTLAFKDVGARFLARALSYFTKKEAKKLTVIVATSGDTGSAVANGFYNVPNIEVIILYPSSKVSGFQEQQMTTLGGNITALELDGTFDDCQKLVKEAFLDVELKSACNLTSANSINMARLLPQAVYYFYAWAQLSPKERENVVFSIPSGNYGNLSAGLIAQQMGLPITHFLACSNANDTVPMYLWKGKFEPKPSVATISNAMDVGNPSNFVRMLHLFKGKHHEMVQAITGYSYTDDATRSSISQVYALTGYILDPHGAVGYLGVSDYLNSNSATCVVLETAHPVKFKETVEDQIGREVPMPAHVELTKLEKKSIPFGISFDEFKSFLLRKQQLIIAKYEFARKLLLAAISGLKKAYFRVRMKELITKKMKSPVWIVALSITASEILYIAISLLFNEPIFGFWIMATAGIAGGVSFVASSTMRSNYIQIEAQKEELERLNQLNQELFSAISHDIRSPLSSISMVLDLVTSKTLTTEESVELLHDLFVDIGHLIQFLDELLLWSKRQIDKKPLIPEDLSTKYVIEETVHLYKKLIEKKGISLDLNNIEGSVLVDKGSYSFVVRNVLQNAIKFTPKGGSVSVSVQEKGAELTTLIKDSGVGIDAHTINAILTKSSYTSTLGTNNEKGVGFGLLASIGYLEKQEGCLHIESELGKGTTVSIILPKSQPFFN